MLKGYHFVYFGPEPWEGLWRNRHQLMTRFAKHNLVLYVEPRRHLRPTLAAWKSEKLSLAPWRWKPLSHIENSLYVYHQPPFAPISGGPLLRTATKRLRQGLLSAAARRLNLNKPIVWISRPSLADLRGVFDARLTIYHVVDEYSEYVNDSPAQRARTRSHEQSVLRQADLVVVVSPSLLADKRQYNPHTHLVPNAVEYEAYEQCLTSGAPLPDDLAAVPRPRLGYIGLIGGKLDLALLEDVARARPAWSLVFLGALAERREEKDWGRLSALPNVHYLGQVPAARVPDYVRGFDVGLMPYRQNRHVQYVSPLKLYDYLAAGKPVVSVPMPALDGFRHVVHTATDAAGFVAAIETVLREDTPDLALARRQLAAANSWEQRVEHLSGLIQARLGQADPVVAAGRT